MIECLCMFTVAPSAEEIGHNYREMTLLSLYIVVGKPLLVMFVQAESEDQAYFN